AGGGGVQPAAHEPSVAHAFGASAKPSSSQQVQPPTPSPRAATGRDGSVRIVAAGAIHTCAAGLDRMLFCWGGNTSGQLGDGTHAVRFAPVPVLSDVVETAAGDATHSPAEAVRWPDQAKSRTTLQCS